MKSQRHSLLTLSILGLILISIMLFQSIGQTQPKPTGRVKVMNRVKMLDDKEQVINVYALATLVKDGQAVRSSEIDTTDTWSQQSYYVNWENLPLGAYEVHFEAQGYGKVVKRIVVSSDATATVVLSSLSKNDELWGAGPTFFDLQNQIATLTAENKDLKARVAQLEKGN